MPDPLTPLWFANPDAARVLAAVCSVTDLNARALLGNSRMRALSDARFIAAHELRRLGFSTTEISLVICRNHSTVTSALQRYDQYFAVDAAFRRKARAVADMLRSSQTQT